MHVPAAEISCLVLIGEVQTISVNTSITSDMHDSRMYHAVACICTFLLAAVSLERFSVALTLQLKCYQSLYVTETRPGAPTGWPAALRLILPCTFTFIG